MHARSFVRLRNVDIYEENFLISRANSILFMLSIKILNFVLAMDSDVSE